MASTSSPSSFFRVVEHIIPGQYIREYPQALSGEQEDTLRLAVKQYIPLNNPNPRRGDVTIIAAQANAFPKEVYEPLWEDLIRLTDGDNTGDRNEGKQAAGFRIRSIWIADVAHQGTSGLLNEDLIGNDPSLADHARDLLYLINLKREDMPRPIMGIGHSMGGTSLVGTALMHPRLFTSLVLLDPMHQTKLPETKSGAMDIRSVQYATFRKSRWPSRAAARAELVKSPFYRSWDPRALERWVEYGLREVGPRGDSRNIDMDAQTEGGKPTACTSIEAQRTSHDFAGHPNTQTPTPPVVLTTPPSQEAFTYARPNHEAYGMNGNPINRSTHADLDPAWPHIFPLYRPEIHSIFEQLPKLRPSALHIFGDKSAVCSADENARKLAATGVGVGGSGGVAAGRVKGVTLPNVGHLIPMQAGAVQKTAQIIAEWIAQEVAIWAREDDEFRRTWINGKSMVQKQVIDDAWVRMFGGPPAVNQKKGKSGRDGGSKI